MFKLKANKNRILIWALIRANNEWMNAFFETTNGFNFQIIDPLIESRGVRLTWFDCNIPWTPGYREEKWKINLYTAVIINANSIAKQSKAFFPTPPKPVKMLWKHLWISILGKMFQHLHCRQNIRSTRIFIASISSSSSSSPSGHNHYYPY